ncbi:MAG: hypothetical protein J4F42_10990 [Desulfurellaceae bacterium]|nr:hypothetical protein [Desulfurellaceae bacterium]
MINTLRFADRLKEAGFAGAQAEALARVLGDELTEQLPSKADFMALQADFKTLEVKFDALEAKFDGLEEKFSGLEVKFSGLEAKFDGLRFTLNIVLVLVGLLVALGLIEPVSKLFGS